MACKVSVATHVMGRKWAMAIIEEIAFGKFEGFNEFVRKTKDRISPRALSMEIQEMEKTGLIKNISRNNVTNYELTKKGQELHKIILENKKWNVRWDHTPKECLTHPCTECEKFFE